MSLLIEKAPLFSSPTWFTLQLDDRYCISHTTIRFECLENRMQLLFNFISIFFFLQLKKNIIIKYFARNFASEAKEEKQNKKSEK